MTTWEDKLWKAVDNNDLELAKAILATNEVKKHGDLNRKEWTRDKAPLHHAAYKGKDDMIRVMVEGGFDVNSYWVIGSDRLTALHCVGISDVDTVELLLDLGADQTLVGRWEEGGYAEGTPLEWARKDRDEVVERVLTKHLAKDSFEAMDSLEKLMQKSKKFKELEEAHKIQSEITEKTSRKRELEEKIKEEEEELRNDKKKLKTLEDDLGDLEKLPSFRDMDKLKGQVEEIDTIEKKLKKVLEEEKESVCPVCFVIPRQVLTCEECDGWVCQDCVGQLVFCTKCQVDLAVKPMRRCRAMERVVGVH